MYRVLLSTALGCALASLAGGSASAEKFTYVSSSGSDNIHCSRVYPCRTLNGALEHTDPGGQITILDSGTFGTAMINKSVSIVADGAVANTSATLAASVVVNAPDGAVVSLRGLVLEGGGTAGRAVSFAGRGALNISDCVIRGYGRAEYGEAIYFAPSTGEARLAVVNTMISANMRGVVVSSAAHNALAILDNVVVEKNAVVGVRSDGAKALVRLNDSTITNNDWALTKPNGGRIVSFGNNVIAGNTNSAVPEVVPLE